MLQMKDKKFMKALNKHRANLPEIAEMYYARKWFEDKVKDRTYEKVYYVHLVEDILVKFGMGSINELLLLLHHHMGEDLGECQYCGLHKTRVKTRTAWSGYNTMDCEHTGICILCKEPHIRANKEGVCRSCTWEKDEQEERRKSYDDESTRYRFLNYVGNYEYMNNIDTVKEAEAMMEWASAYYNEFKGISDSLKRDQKGIEECPTMTSTG